MDSDRAKIARANRYKAKFHALREKYDSVNAINEEYKREIALAKVKLRKLEDENDLLVDQIAMDIDYQPEISAHLYPQTPELQYSTVIALDRIPIRPPPVSRNHSYDHRDLGHPPPPPGPPAQLAERHPRDRSSRRHHQHTSSTTNGRGGSGKGHRQNGNGAVPPPPLTTNGSSGVIEPKTEPEPSVIPSPPEVEEELEP